jgi:hypothetical protein
MRKKSHRCFAMTRSGSLARRIIRAEAASARASEADDTKHRHVGGEGTLRGARGVDGLRH